MLIKKLNKKKKEKSIYYNEDKINIFIYISIFNFRKKKYIINWINNKNKLIKRVLNTIEKIKIVVLKLIKLNLCLGLWVILHPNPESVYGATQHNSTKSFGLAVPVAVGVDIISTVFLIFHISPLRKVQHHVNL